MKELSLIEMESYSGGAAAQVVDGFCAGIGGSGILASVLRIASNIHPVAKAAYWTTAVGCAGWAVYRLS